MKFRRFLTWLYPKKWRKQYGEEYLALLEELPLSGKNIISSLYKAALLRLRSIYKWLTIIMGVVGLHMGASACRHLGLTNNILWAPSNPVRALGLILTLMPLGFAVYICIRPRIKTHN